MKAPAYKHLKVGDPWTEITDEPITGRDDATAIEVGQIFTKSFDTGEPGRAFRVVAIHPTDGWRIAYEARFIGWAIVRKNADGSLDVTIEEGIPDERS